MQDIPRNELLDKLAAGWKVRRKSWATECTISQSGGSTTAHWLDLLNNDWEGQPPKSITSCVYSGLTIHAAMRYMKEDCSSLQFIRRKAWHSSSFVKNDIDFVSLTVSDIIAEDWEVWG
jgi:hypothetical protein